MTKTIFVIGANAALAGEVLPRLAEEHTIITAGKTNCDVYCDVTKPFTIPQEVDVVINFAANFGGTSDNDILAAVHANVLGALHVCQAAKRAKAAHVITISSIFAEVDTGSPNFSIYALTKKHGDELAQYYCQENSLPITVLRPSRIYGDNDKFRKNQPFLYDIIDKAQHSRDIILYGTNDAHRNYIHAADIAEILKRVIDRRLEGVYACVHPTDTTYSEVAQAAQEAFGAGGQLVFQDNKPDIPDDTFPIDRSLYEKIDYQPTVSLQAGIERIKNYRADKEKA